MTKPAYAAHLLALSTAVLLFPSVALAQHESNASGDEPWAIRIARVQQQQTTGAQPQQTTGAEQKGKLPGDEKVEAAVEEAVRRFRIGVEAGVGLDPEIIMFGVHGRFGPYFTRDVVFRPGIEFGIGEVTTIFGVNLEGIFTFSRAGSPEWVPYIGGGPNFALSHQSFEAPPPEEGEEAPPEEDDSRFDFSDTDFKAGFNFIAGARKENGMFFEMKATAWGVSNIRLLAGFNF